MKEADPSKRKLEFSINHPGINPNVMDKIVISRKNEMRAEKQRPSSLPDEIKSPTAAAQNQ